MTRKGKISLYQYLAFAVGLLLFMQADIALAQCGGKDYHLCMNNATDTAQLKVTNHTLGLNESIVWYRKNAQGDSIPLQRDASAASYVLKVPVDSILLHQLASYDTLTYNYSIVKDTTVTRLLPNMPARPDDLPANYYPNVDAGVKFKVGKPLTLKNVTVYITQDSTVDDTIKITLQDTAGNDILLDTAGHTYTATVDTIITHTGLIRKDSIAVNLNFYISDTAKEYQLVAKGSHVISMRRGTAAAYPYGQGSLLSVVGPTINPSDHYYFFYKWNVSYDSLVPIPLCSNSVHLILLTDSLVQRGLDGTGISKDTITICSGLSKTLNANVPGYTGSTFHWLDGVVDSVDITNNPKYFQVVTTLYVLDDTTHHTCALNGHLNVEVYPVLKLAVDSITVLDCHASLDSTFIKVFASVDNATQSSFKFVWQKDGVPKDSTIVSYPSPYVSSTDSVTGADTSLSIIVTDITTGCTATKNHLIPAGLKTLKLNDTLQVSLYVCSGNPFTPITIKTIGGFEDSTDVKYRWDSLALADTLADLNSPYQPHLHVGNFPFTVSDKSNCTIRDTVHIIPRYGTNSVGHDQLGFNTYTASDSTVWSAITIFDKADLDTLYAGFDITGISVAINHDNNNIWGSAVVRIREDVETDGNTITNFGRTVFETNLITFEDFYSPFSCISVPGLAMDKDSTYAIEVQVSPYNSNNVLGLDTNETVHNKGGWLVNYHAQNGRQFARGNWNIRATFTDKLHVGIDETPAEGISRLATYPNPTTGITTVAFEVGHAQKVNLSVTDLMGREVLQVLNNELVSEGKQQVEINVGTLSAGIYTIVLQDDHGITGKKMVLIK